MRNDPKIASAKVRSLQAAYGRKGLVMAAVVKFELCEGCAACVDTCPSGAIELKDVKAVIDTEVCADCAACVDTCPTSAIEME
jgi:ferredoxin